MTYQEMALLVREMQMARMATAAEDVMTMFSSGNVVPALERAIQRVPKVGTPRDEKVRAMLAAALAKENGVTP